MYVDALYIITAADQQDSDDADGLCGCHFPIQNEGHGSALSVHKKWHQMDSRATSELTQDVDQLRFD